MAASPLDETERGTDQDKCQGPVALREDTTAAPIQFTLVPGHNDLQVRALLGAHLSHALTKSARQFWVHVLAALGGLIAVCVMIPDVIPAQARNAVLASWATCCIGVVLLAVSELRWRRREQRLLKTHTTTPKA